MYAESVCRAKTIRKQTELEEKNHSILEVGSHECVDPTSPNLART